MASDSSYSHRVGFHNNLDITDEGGWAFETLPKEEILLAGYHTALRAETALDLLPPEDRELRELMWNDLGLVTMYQQLEEAGREAGGANANKAQPEPEEEEEEEEEEEGEGDEDDNDDNETVAEEDQE